MDNQELLKAMSDIMDRKLEPIILTLDEHSKELKTLNIKIDKTGKKIDITYDEVGLIKEEMKNIEKSIGKIKATQGILEDVTAHNWNEIRNIKRQIR